MKFFTDEWYHNTLISQMCFSLRKSNRAESFSDKFFEKLYKSESGWYAKHLKRASRFNRIAFDKDAAQAEFDKNYQDNLEFVNTLPKEIIEKIADIRVFALGTVSYDIYDELTRFCGRLNRECEAVQSKYDDSLEDVAEVIGWTPINMLNMLAEAEITSVKHENDALTIESTERVIVLNGADPCESLVGARVIAFEVTRADEDGRFCLGLLCENKNGKLFDESLYFKGITVEEK